MRRVAFVVAILLGLVVIVFGAARGLGYEPASRADQPPLAACDESHAMLTAAVEGCVRADGRWVQGMEDGVLVARCVPSLGVYPLPRGGK